MANYFKHKDKLEKNKGIIMQISIIASLLIVLLLFENKTRSAEIIPKSYVGITITIDSTENEIVKIPIPNSNSSKDSLVNTANTESSFPGGTKALKEYMKNEMQYSEEAKKKDIQGRVIVSFTVTKKGTIKDTKVIRSIHTIIDNEALRLVKNMPNWNPARLNGKAIKSTQTLPIIFIN